jgi:enoyl-CoA hydratase/carnithine racemase
MSGTIHVEAVGPHVRVLTIDNPPMNPLGVAMRETFMRTLDEVETHEDLRAIVVTGTGRAFCSGDDLKDVAPQGEDLAGFGRLLERLDASRAPIIAAINALRLRRRQHGTGGLSLPPAAPDRCVARQGHAADRLPARRRDG